MRKMKNGRYSKIKGGVASAMVVVAGLMMVPAGSAPAQAATPAATIVKLTQSCTNGDFKGEADLTTTFTPSGEGGDWTTTVDSYRITRSNGQAGGNKANVNLFFWVERGGVGPEVQKSVWSADAMIQDGAWHNLGISGTIANVPIQLKPLYSSSGYAVLSGVAEVKFVFDKSGSDPSCVATKSTNWGRDLSGLRSIPEQVRYEAPLRYCSAGSNGGTCTITSTDTVSSSVTVGAGINYDWITAHISYTWTQSKSVSVAVTSPPLNAGQKFYVYPTGTRHEFSTSAHFFGQRVLVAPGSAFEVDGSLHYNTVDPRAYVWGE
ncbi:hypothetical protein ACPPVW_18825 [Leifsonia sp. McL0607]|uniref:hypothetical protein n=1 Tax=Leifsonia sp. McL0607 TaxID=3415672 RepID=UPI003CE721FB